MIRRLAVASVFIGAVALNLPHASGGVAGHPSAISPVIVLEIDSEQWVTCRDVAHYVLETGDYPGHVSPLVADCIGEEDDPRVGVLIDLASR